MNADYICNSITASWRIVEIYDTEVPDEILAALRAEQKLNRKDNIDGSVYTLMWNDMFFYHGEEGWVLNDDTLEICEKWLEAHRDEHSIREDTAFWFRIKTS